MYKLVEILVSSFFSSLVVLLPCGVAVVARAVREKRDLQALLNLEITN